MKMIKVGLICKVNLSEVNFNFCVQINAFMYSVDLQQQKKKTACITMMEALSYMPSCRQLQACS